MSLAVTGKGTLFRRWSAADEWTNMMEIVTITGPGMSRDTIDTTSLSSTGGYREFIGGFRNGGTVVLNMIFRRDNFDTMKEDFESDDLQNYEILLPDDESTSLEFEGLVMEMPLTIPTDDKVTMDVTIQISGEPVVNSGSGSSA